MDSAENNSCFKYMRELYYELNLLSNIIGIILPLFIFILSMILSTRIYSFFFVKQLIGLSFNGSIIQHVRTVDIA